MMEIAENRKISFCIVCQNRLHQLKQTLLKNIQDNQDFPCLEVVLLNYNSRDGMEEWVRDHFTNYLDTGKLVYYYTPRPTTFSHSHSKNVAFKIATGKIVCSINADHFTGYGFAGYVNDCFEQQNDMYLTTIDYYGSQPGYKVEKDVFGKVCVKKSDFLKVRGFDEHMTRYGFEDCDFTNRLEMAALKRVLIDNSSFLGFLPHDNNERYSNSAIYEEVFAVYLRFINPWTTEVLLLFNDDQFEAGTLIDHTTENAGNCKYAYEPRVYNYENSLLEGIWTTGQWKAISGGVSLNAAGKKSEIYLYDKNNNNILTSPSGLLYYKTNDKDSISKLLNYNYFTCNRSMMEHNLRFKIISPNVNPFGTETLFKNFSKTPIII